MLLSFNELLLYANRSNWQKSNSEFHPGQGVKVKLSGNKGWTTPGRVICKSKARRTYIVEMDNGNVAATTDDAFRPSQRELNRRAHTEHFPSVNMARLYNCRGSGSPVIARSLLRVSP
ncbi:hypothetical protein CRENBAI_005467 [Crenichthys baileyi]|uniref:Uncharacterized protein n=1 Tax=Crenichthys baileyi TaxID=28760 RepID=A0AAV9S7B6_9TELE